MGIEVDNNEMKLPTERPRFRHDCERCTFLGRFVSEDLPAGCDLYFCLQVADFPTVLARTSDNPLSYISGLGLADTIPELGEAKRRAQERGLLK